MTKVDGEGVVRVVWMDHRMTYTSRQMQSGIQIQIQICTDTNTGTNTDTNTGTSTDTKTGYKDGSGDDIH